MLHHLANALKPPSDMHPADWCATHVHIENSERSSKFDPAQVRWWRKPMGHYADYETQQMVCIMPTGTGKSTFFEAINCWIVAEAPGSVLYASLTDENAKLWAETRFIKAAKKCQPLDHLWPADYRKAVRKEAIVWPHMFQLFGGANISNFQEVSITYGQGDEVWDWKPGLVREWLARSHNRENRKFVMASQAGEIADAEGNGKTSDLHLEHAKCRQWDFAWQCPDCGHVQVFDFAGLKYPAEGTDQERADAVVMTCTACPVEFADTPANRRMLYESYKENDGYLCTKPDGERGKEGFHVDRTAVWWQAWGDDVLKKLAADAMLKAGDITGIRQWTQKDRARGFTDTLTTQPVKLKTSGYTRGDFEDGQKIDDEVLRTFALDVGGDHLWGRVRAWSEGGASKGLWAGYIATPEQAEEIRIKYGVRDKDTVVDVGFNQEEVAGWIVRYGWTGFKGEGQKQGWPWEIKTGPQKGKFEQRVYSKKWFALSKEKQRAECWHVATEPLQYILQRLISGEGAEWLCEDDAPPTLEKHLNNERLTTKADARGREVKKWTRHGAQHLRDCEIYGLARALQMKVFSTAAQESE